MHVIDSLKVKEKHITEARQLKKRLQECERLKKIISGDYIHAIKSVRIISKGKGLIIITTKCILAS